MSRIHLDVEQRCLRIDDYKYFYEWKEDYDSDYDELGELRRDPLRQSGAGPQG